MEHGFLFFRGEVSLCLKKNWKRNRNIITIMTIIMTTITSTITTMITNIMIMSTIMTMVMTVWPTTSIPTITIIPTSTAASMTT